MKAKMSVLVWSMPTPVIQIYPSQSARTSPFPVTWLGWKDHSARGFNLRGAEMAISVPVDPTFILCAPAGPGQNVLIGFFS
jgi:hypothetical protein